MIQDVWDIFTSKFQHYVNMGATWSFSYGVFHLLQVKWGWKEAGCVFGAHGLGGFLISISIFIILSSILSTYQEYKKEKTS